MMTTNQQNHSPQKRVSSVSIFSGFESSGAKEYGSILRTRSLDEATSPVHTREGSEQERSSGHSEVANTGNNALHTSFDNALLGSGSIVLSPQAQTEQHAWDEEGDSSIGDISGKKHVRPTGTSPTTGRKHRSPIRPPPATVRKLPRRTGVESGRPPSSAVKRRRAPATFLAAGSAKSPELTSNLRQQHRLSPIRTPFHHSGSANTPATGRRILENPLGVTPHKMTPTPMPGYSVKPPSKLHNTYTTATAASTLETTFESLSVRKLALDESNQSRDDERTQNTSLSSLSADGQTHLASPKSLPIHGQLFFDDEAFGYSDDDSVQARDVVGRTRLNFNMVLSPERNKRNAKDKIDFGKKHADFECDEVACTYTPARPSNKDMPHTPRDVKLHFPLEAECSPIPGVREETVECAFSCSKSAPGLLGVGRASENRQRMAMVSNLPMKSKAKDEGSNASETSNERARRLRPMPDMSAFESAAGSSRDRSSDDSATVDSKGMPSSQRFLCPPTPVRTPAWAHENSAHAFFGRQNSLITTKVLLSCPSQVLQGRCSLESSVLDDDSKGQNIDSIPFLSEKKASEVEGFRQEEKVHFSDEIIAQASSPRHPVLAPPQLTRQMSSPQKVGAIISFSSDFEVLGMLGSGAFADVYKARSLRDNRLYAVKRNRRQFRGKRDRDMALTEVQCMQRLQSTCVTEPKSNAGSESAQKSCYSLYLLFFYNAWQEDGYFFCQTELCCRDTCRELLDSLRFLWNSSKKKYPSLLRHLPPPEGVEASSESDVFGRRAPINSVWKILHDTAAGLSHIHSHGVVHNDIKPSNIFFVEHPRFGAMCKIGDFGMACDIGSSVDGQEGDTKYMPPESLVSNIKRTTSDIFCLGLTLFEIANDQHIQLPSEGPRWHELRREGGIQLPNLKDDELVKLIKQMTDPEGTNRLTADAILEIPTVNETGNMCDEFLRDYLKDIQEFDRVEGERQSKEFQDEQTPRNGTYRSSDAVSPSLSMMLPAGPLLSPCPF